MSKRIDLIKKLQKEMDRRTEIENMAVQLISEGKCEEATALLSSLDDNVMEEIVDELEQAEKTNENLRRSASLIVMTDGGDINQADADLIAKETVGTIISELPEEIRTLAVIRYVLKRCEVILEQSKFIL